MKATVVIGASRSRVHDGLSSLDGLAGWWTPQVEGDATAGGDLTFHFDDQHVRIHVDTNGPTAVAWTCREHTKFPEWSGTHITFALRAPSPNETAVDFEHEGLEPECDCHEMCSRGWEHYLASLAGWATGAGGSPWHSPTWRSALS